MSYFCKINSENFVRFVLLVSASVVVYGTSLVILLKYFAADLQSRNDKFDGVSNAESMLRKEHRINKKGQKGTRRHSVLVTDSFLRV